MTRLRELYHAYEGYNDELEVLDPNNGHQAEFTNVQDRFYVLAGRVESTLNVASTSDTSSNISNDIVDTGLTNPVKKRRIKLPEAPLPTFDGKYENWLSFKNAFHNMIGSQTDLTEIDKLHYLKSTLTGEAAAKVRIFEIEGINYSNAWKILERAYEVKRILISRHLSLILKLPVLDKETNIGLQKLADEMQQHVATLSSLGVSVGHEIIVHILENKLPKITLEKWETSLEKDEFPKPEQLYEFLYKTAVVASKRERSKNVETENHPIKRRRVGPTNQSFTVNTHHVIV